MNYLLFNKKINFNYEIIATYVAGIVLKGYEVKAIKNNLANIDNSYVTFKKNEPIIINFLVKKLDYAPINSLSEDRPKKLLLKKNEIKKLILEKQKKRLTIVVRGIIKKKNLIKVEICLCKGQKKADKREKIKKRDLEREVKKTNFFN
ncbi:SsrA-binding protein [symbiont of Argiope bruennichi]|uniref:SsrA-binding protein n=1 Tax=symbiont of Argiope bruennichi TaxID=2810479 RepID=UPI003DA3F2D8